MQNYPFASPLRSVVLHDVQSLFGGHALWADSSLRAFAQTIGVGLWEKRYQTILTLDEWAAIEQLVVQHHFFSLPNVLSKRPGVPDEACPLVVVTAQSGDNHKLQKWANDAHPDFDAVYDYLCALCRADGELIQRGEIIYQGVFDWQWRPTGFDAAPFYFS